MGGGLYARLKAVSKAQESKEGRERPVVPAAPKSCRSISAQRPSGDDPLTDHEAALLCRLEGVPEVRADELLFLDTETTGLGRGAGTVAFLVGYGRFSDGRFESEQLWMGDYDEEDDLISRLAALLPGKTLVTFNGKSFDLPLLEARFIMQGRRFPKNVHSIDLLTHARRIFKLRLQRVNLSRLEEMLLGRVRVGDIPGSEVPKRYFDFLKTGDLSLLEQVFEHNAQDVFSMGELMRVMARAYAEPAGLVFGEDIFSVGRVFERRGEHDAARKCYVLASGSYTVASVSRISLMDKRAGDHESAALGFASIADRDVFACVELAKHFEHRARGFEKALDYTDKAIAMCDNEVVLNDLFIRRARLLAKIKRNDRRG